MSFLSRIDACNTGNTAHYLPFLAASRRIGWLRPDFARHLAAWPDVFSLTDNAVSLRDGLNDFDQCSEALDIVVRSLVSSGIIHHYLDEPYPVTAGERHEALMVIDRGAAAHFGIRSFGQHLNGYVMTSSGLRLWIARRARDRHIFPGRLDNLVAGGLPWNISLRENLLKECHEEAGMPAALAARAVPVGTVSYLAESEKGIKPDTLYCYDLELPAGFVPRCMDGEVESFELMEAAEVMEIVRESEAFKPNCNLVSIDFLVRHGILDPEDGDYTRIVSRLHRSL